jgi:hypothetical protein
VYGSACPKVHNEIKMTFSLKNTTHFLRERDDCAAGILYMPPTSARAMIFSAFLLQAVRKLPTHTDAVRSDCTFLCIFPRCSKGYCFERSQASPACFSGKRTVSMTMHIQQAYCRQRHSTDKLKLNAREETSSSSTLSAIHLTLIGPGLKSDFRRDRPANNHRGQ